MRALVLACVLTLVSLCGPLGASAATFTVDDLGVSATMSGEIAPGDAERLAALFLAVKPIANYYPYPNSLYLNSPGGDVSEAIRLAELVKAFGLSVVVAPDGKGACASSCFLIYVGAIERSAAGIDTIRAQGAKGNLGPLGVHRPFLRQPSDGVSGAREQERVMGEMREYLVKSGVGHSLIDKMMSHASNDIHWLNSEEVRALGAFSPGVEEQLIARCGYNARQEAKMSAREYIESSQSGTVRCTREYMNKSFVPLIHATVLRLREGWRPWR